MKSLGKIAYDAYCSATGWKSAVTGAQLPQWEHTKSEIQAAWTAAALAVADEIGGVNNGGHHNDCA